MSQILNMFGNGNASGALILLQAVGAAMRGESPQTFMKRLANTHPQLRKVNLDDLYGSAQKLCQEQGLNPDEVASQIDNVIGPSINK